MKEKRDSIWSTSLRNARQMFFNPLTAGAAYIRVFIFLLAHQVPPFKHVKDKI